MSNRYKIFQFFRQKFSLLFGQIQANKFIFLAYFFTFGLFFSFAMNVFADTVSDIKILDITATVSGAQQPGTGGSGSNLTQITFTGLSFPGAKLTVLKDGSRYTTLVVGPDGNFRISVNGLPNGNYQFAIYAQDKNGIESSSYVANVQVIQNQPVAYNNILIPPTLSTSNTVIGVGQNFVLYGYSTPGSNVLAEIPGVSVLGSAVADSTGLYQIALSANFDPGLIYIRTRAELNGYQSNYSKPIQLLVYTGTQIPAPPPELAVCVDFNKDNRINLIDFSILLFWFDKNSPPARVDCNRDNKIDIKDFSILMYFWTG